MNIPPQFQDAMYHLGKLTDTLKAHEEWLHSLRVVSCADILEKVKQILEDAELQTSFSEESIERIEKQLSNPPLGFDPKAWKDFLPNLTPILADLRMQRPITQ